MYYLCATMNSTGKYLKPTGYRFKPRTRKLIKQLQLLTKKTQDQVVWAGMHQYKKSLQGNHKSEEPISTIVDKQVV